MDPSHVAKSSGAWSSSWDRAASMLAALGAAHIFSVVLQAGSMLVGTLDWAAVLDEPSSGVYRTFVLAG